MADFLTTKSVQEAITESIRDLLTMKATIPLGDKSLKVVHTNQFIWLEKLYNMMELENFELLSQIMSNSNTRWSPYEKDRWYIEGMTITNDGDRFDMELELNPFPSSLRKYRDDWVKIRENYQNAIKKNNSTNNTTTTNSVKSTSNENTTLKGGQGTVIDNLVKSIVGTVTDSLKKAQLIHEWLRKNVRYASYSCSRYKSAVACYNNRRRLNCADTARLTCAMMLSAGLNAYIVHRTYNGGHFWTVIEINGRKYASDQTGDGSSWNTVWRANGRVGNGGYQPYSRKNGSVPDC